MTSDLHEIPVPPEPDYVAPDGSAVRLLCEVDAAGMAHFELPSGSTTQEVVHKTVDEVWFVLSGHGWMWRRRDRDGVERETELLPGLSLNLPVGTRFQFKADGSESLAVIGVTVPRWPGPDEAVEVEGIW
jgi:mannose-6-phosphate isomerase-like protein (cupin superfamily)